MPRILDTYADIVAEWERLAVSMATNAGELPQLEPYRLKLQTLLEEARDLARQQAALTASRQDVTKRLQTSLTQGKRLATLVRIGVREHYGIDSEKLVEFGVPPFRGRNRTKKEVPAPTTPNPTPSQT